MSRVYFPLRTSVELFGDRQTPEAVTRVKQAAALYDEVVIEDGLYTADLSTAGGNSMWFPWEGVDPQRLKRTRTPADPGSPVAFGMQKQPGLGLAPEGPVHWVSQGDLVIDYAAEFHSGILDDLLPLEPDWLTVISPGHSASAQPPEVTDAVKALDFQDFADRELMKDRNTFEKQFIAKNFNRDAAWASYLEATFNVTALYLPKLERANLAPERSGTQALKLLVPNVGSLSWEAILEFRTHPGHRDAREQLRAFEEAASTREPESLADFKDEVQREITAAFFAALTELKPNLKEDVASEAMKAAIGLIPVAGSIGGGALSAAEIARDSSAFVALGTRRSWICGQEPEHHKASGAVERCVFAGGPPLLARVRRREPLSSSSP